MRKKITTTIAIILCGFFLTALSSCSSNKQWEGVWVSTLSGDWKFQLNSNGTAEVQLPSFGSYRTEWTVDDGNAFIGGIGQTKAFILTPSGEVYKYSKSGNISSAGISMQKR